jgi:3-oxoacyl-[acyl-carrier-protein] synthase II
MPRRVVVTGYGLVTPGGNAADGFWRAMMAGTSFLGPLRRFTCGGIDHLVGGEVELGASDTLPGHVDSDPERARCTHLLLAASRRAMAAAGLPSDRGVRERTGVAVGTTMASERQVSASDDAWVLTRGVDASLVTRADNHLLAAHVAEEHALGGPALLSATACSSGNAALAWSYDLIASGSAPAMLACGVDTHTRAVFTGFLRLGALSKSVCRPFDKRRDGVTFGEGAAAILLEEREHALRRGANIRAELAGYGISNDAYHVTAPDPNGEGFARAMRQALETTGTPPDAVDYVSAHGTGTPYNDVAETRAMKEVFGARAPRVPISSIKSMLGHTNGAASAIEAIACTLALEHQAVPPTAGLTEPDPACDLDYVPGTGRSMSVRTCLNLSAGFGGLNLCVVLKGAA